MNLKEAEERIYGGKGWLLKKAEEKIKNSEDEVISFSKTPQDDFHFIFVHFTEMNLKTTRCNCQHFRVYISF